MDSPAGATLIRLFMTRPGTEAIASTVPLIETDPTASAAVKTFTNERIAIAFRATATKLVKYSSTFFS